MDTERVGSMCLEFANWLEQ